MSEYEMLLKKINVNKDIELKDIERTEIEDIRNIKVNNELPIEERIVDFLKKVKNPYVFKVNDTLVKVSFGTKNIDVKQCLNNIVKSNI